MVLACVVIGIILLNHKDQTPIIPPTPLADEEVNAYYANEVAKSLIKTDDVSTWKTYKDDSLKFSFSYPSTWREDAGSQIFNYPESIAQSGSVFSKDTSKIAFGVSDTDQVIYEDSPDIPKETTISGQKAYFVENKNYIFYKITIPNSSNKFIDIAFYGDQQNKFVLEEMLRSIKFTSNLSSPPPSSETH